MKKFLFTLAALLMVGSISAEEYCYIENFEVAQNQLGTEIDVPVMTSTIPRVWIPTRMIP